MTFKITQVQIGFSTEPPKEVWYLEEDDVCLEAESSKLAIVNRALQHGDRLASRALKLIEESVELQKQVREILNLPEVKEVTGGRG